MSPEATVNAFIHAIERKDVGAAVALVAPDISYENMPIDPIVGRDGVRATLEAFLGAASEVDWRILSQVASGNRVVNERLDRFKVGATWVELPVAGVFEIGSDGLITLWRDYFDMGSYQRQMAAATAS